MNIKKFDTRPVVLPIYKIIKESSNINTYIFKYSIDSKPGQFVMMWIPGVDEKPFSVSFDNSKELWLTVAKVGLATEKLFELKEGDKVGIRGPFGTSYEFQKGDNLALVAGGYGAAPMYFVAREAIAKGCKVDFFIGARNKDLLLFAHKVTGLKNVNLHFSTNDGSAGFKGFVTEILEKVLKEKKGKQKINKVFTCGPELMMKAVGEIAQKYKAKCFMSMEKYMKCGFGVCGQCAIDDTGELACKKGPVMPYDYVKKLPEFGRYHRDSVGKKNFF